MDRGGGLPKTRDGIGAAVIAMTMRPHLPWLAALANLLANRPASTYGLHKV